MKTAVLLLAALLAMAACRGEPQSDTPRVEEAWVRLPARPGGPGAVYFVVRGGARDTRLEGISSSYAERIELHGPGMQPIGPQFVPARGELAFAPRGRHGMLYWRPVSTRHAMNHIPLTFHFNRGPGVTVRAVYVPAGIPEPEFVDSFPDQKECRPGVRQDGERLIATNCGPQIP